MANKIYACDISGTCPYEAEFNSSAYACRNHCGLGVDEDSVLDLSDEDEITAEDLAEYQGRYK